MALLLLFCILVLSNSAVVSLHCLTFLSKFSFEWISFLFFHFSFSFLLESKCWGEQPVVHDGCAIVGHFAVVSVIPQRCCRQI